VAGFSEKLKSVKKVEPTAVDRCVELDFEVINFSENKFKSVNRQPSTVDISNDLDFQNYLKNSTVDG